MLLLLHCWEAPRSVLTHVHSCCSQKHVGLRWGGLGVRDGWAHLIESSIYPLWASVSRPIKWWVWQQQGKVTYWAYLQASSLSPERSWRHLGRRTMQQPICFMERPWPAWGEVGTGPNSATINGTSQFFSTRPVWLRIRRCKLLFKNAQEHCWSCLRSPVELSPLRFHRAKTIQTQNPCIRGLGSMEGDPWASQGEGIWTSFCDWLANHGS